MKTCPNCAATDLPDTAKACGHCGTVLGGLVGDHTAQSPPPPPSDGPSRRWWPWLLIGTLVIGAAIGGYLIWRTGDEADGAATDSTLSATTRAGAVTDSSSLASSQTTTPLTTTSAPVDPLELIPQELRSLLRGPGGGDPVSVVLYQDFENPASVETQGDSGDEWAFLGNDFVDEAEVAWAQGAMEIRSGFVVFGDWLYPGQAAVFRLRQVPGANYEIEVMSGDWGTAGYARWGVYGGDDGVWSNVWDGASLLSEPERWGEGWTYRDFWVTLGIGPDSGVLYVDIRSGGGSEGMFLSQDAWRPLPDRWDLVLQILDNGSPLRVEEFFLLATVGGAP